MQNITNSNMQDVSDSYITQELDELRQRVRKPTKKIDFVILESQQLRLVEQGEYGPLLIEHLHNGNEVAYLLKGSSLTGDGRFPTRKQWLTLLEKKEGAEYDPDSGSLSIPVWDQESANEIHSALLPILAQALDELHDPMLWPFSPETYIPTTVLDDGTEVIEEKRYGKLRLQHGLSGKSRSKVRHIVYIIGGYKTENGRFPAYSGWHWLLHQSHLGRHPKGALHWKFTLDTPEKSRAVNKLLIPLFKESILYWHSAANQSRTNRIIARLREKLENLGVDLEAEGLSGKNPEHEL